MKTQRPMPSKEEFVLVFPERRGAGHATLGTVGGTRFGQEGEKGQARAFVEVSRRRQGKTE